MQPALKSAVRAGPKASRLPNSQRGCVSARSCVPTCDAPSLRDQTTLAVATFLTSTIVSVTFTSPAFADGAVAVSLAEPSVEIAAVSDASIDGVEPLVAPELQDPAPAVLAEASVAAEVDVAPPVATIAEVTPEPFAEIAPVVESATPDDEPAAAEVAAPVEAADEAKMEEVTAAAAAVAPAALVEEVVPPAEAADVEVPVAVAAAVEEPPAPSVSQEVVAEELQPAVAAAALEEAPAVTEPVEAEPAAVEAALPVAAAVLEVESAPSVPVEAEAAPAAVTEAVEMPAVEPEVLAVSPTAVEAAAAIFEAVPEVPPPPAPVAVPVLAAEADVATPVPVAAAADPAPATRGFDLQALLAGATAVVTASDGAGEGPSAEALTYGALGAAAASFVGTFFIAPRFKEAFKEPVDWRDMYAALAARGVKTVTVEEAFAKAKKGAVILDVRLADSYARRSSAPSVNVPLYQPISGWDAASNIRRAGFAFFGIFGTELNENFVAEVAAKVPKNKEVIVMCETGGTIENKPGTQFGFQSRSLKALYYLQQAGYGKVLHMKGGLGEWQRAGLPLSNSPAESAEASSSAPASTRGGRGGTTTGVSTVSGTSRGTARGTSSGSTKARATTKELVSATSRGRK